MWWSTRSCSVSPGIAEDTTNTDWSLEIGQCYRHLAHKLRRSPTVGYGNLADKSIDLARYRHSPKCNSSQSINQLCKSMDLSLRISKVKSPNHRPNHNRILPEHDRKILQRMAKKRQDDLSRQQNALVANTFWAAERTERESLKREHRAQIKDFVQARQVTEREIVVKRREALAAHESFKRLRQYQQQSSKGRRSVQRIESIQAVRRSSLARRAQVERERSQYAKQRRSEAAIGDAIQVERCWTRLAYRLNRAERLRQQLSEEYRQRLIADNEVQMMLHASKLDAAKLVESEQTDKLREQIHERNRQSEEIARVKKLAYEESRAQSQWTAELRNELRRSVSPKRLADIYSY